MNGSPGQRLDEIVLDWSTLRCAHDAGDPECQRARESLLVQHREAVFRYLTAALRDVEAAREVYQEFAVRFLQGKFAAVDPSQGRFGAYLKTALSHMVVDYQRRRRRGTVPIEADIIHASIEDNIDAVEEPWRLLHRRALIARAWKALRSEDAAHGTVYSLLLKTRVRQPGLRSAALAAKVAPRLGRPVNEQGVRKRLLGARRRFSELLIDELDRALEGPSADELEQELLDLRLLSGHVREALARRRAARA